jgi:thioredoxin 1
VTDADFQTEVLKTNQAVLVDFWGPSGSTRRLVSPILKEIDAERGGN